jgi:hypothetical protein
LHDNSKSTLTINTHFSRDAFSICHTLCTVSPSSKTLSFDQIILLNSCNHGMPFSRSGAVQLIHPLTCNRPTLTRFLLQVKQGDSIPNVDLFEDSPGNKVNLAKELSSGKGVIIGVPAAFSPSCSDTHIPGYIASDKLKSAGKVFVVSVNDPFV